MKLGTDKGWGSNKKGLTLSLEQHRRLLGGGDPWDEIRI